MTILDDIKSYWQPFTDITDWLRVMSNDQKRDLLFVLTDNKIDLSIQQWDEQQAEKVLISYLLCVFYDNATNRLIKQVCYRPQFVCVHCGGSFTYSGGQGKKRPKYCLECRASRNIIRRTTTKCVKCGKVFERKNKKAYKKCEDCRYV